MGEPKEKVFYHLYGIIEINRGGEIDIQKLLSNKDDADEEMGKLKSKYGNSPHLIRWDVTCNELSLQEVFGLYTVDEVCEVDEDFKRMIDINISDLSKTRY